MLHVLTHQLVSNLFFEAQNLNLFQLTFERRKIFLEVMSVLKYMFTFVSTVPVQHTVRSANGSFFL